MTATLPRVQPRAEGPEPTISTVGRRAVLARKRRHTPTMKTPYFGHRPMPMLGLVDGTTWEVSMVNRRSLLLSMLVAPLPFAAAVAQPWWDEDARRAEWERYHEEERRRREARREAWD